MLPPALLIGISFVQPLFVSRYVLYCVPAVALLVGAGLAALGRIAGPAALVVIALLGLSTQLHVRAPNGHGDNIRGVDRIIVQYRQPGDAVIYVGQDANYFTAAYPYGLAQLDNIAQAKTAAQNACWSGPPCRSTWCSTGWPALPGCGPLTQPVTRSPRSWPVCTSTVWGPGDLAGSGLFSTS